MKNDKILCDFRKFNEISQHLTKQTVLYFDFIHFFCISLTFASVFDDFKSLLQNFGLIKTDSQIRNF